MSNSRKNNLSIDYTSRDFETIREDLIDYVKRYYPNTHKDFNEASFGSMMIDTVAYVGDMLSYYLDYSLNETFLTTATERKNVLKIGRQLGYTSPAIAASVGDIYLFVNVPAASDGSIDLSYAPVLRAGSTFASGNRSVFTLIGDVDFSSALNTVVVATVDDTTGIPLNYAIRAPGRVVSGERKQEVFTIGSVTDFLRLEVEDSNITDIISVIDEDGHEYYEVEALSQNVVYKEVTNRGQFKESVPSFIRPISAPRRYIVEIGGASTFVQFGNGSEDEQTAQDVIDPSNVVLDIYGKNYITDFSFDPSKLQRTDKMGISPSNTKVFVTYRTNTNSNSNCATGVLNSVLRPVFKFDNRSSLVAANISATIGSLEVTNPQPIVGDVSTPNSEELRQRIIGVHSAQNRAVTKQDYVALAYAMPSKFGAIKRCSILRDADSAKNNLNMYVLAEDTSGALSTANTALKENLKVWLNGYKMISDSLDIMNARVLNIGIKYSIMSDSTRDSNKVLIEANDALRKEFATKMNIGEAFYITRIFKTLSKVDGVLDVEDVKVVTKSGTGYSDNSFNIKRNTTPDGRVIIPKEDMVFEIRDLFTDIEGSIR